MRVTDTLTPKESTLEAVSLWEGTHADAALSPWWRLALAAALAVVAMAATASLLA